MTISKYLTLSQKPDCKRSGLKTYQFFVSLIEIGFQFDAAKNIKSLENSGHRVDKKTRPNANNTPGVPTANLELKQLLIIC